ncbi:MAG TPA: HD domain-containing protein, partial [bacterium]|nr:HD domain-containing protein [bacterium]
APFPSCGFNIMRRSGLLPLVFPDVHQMIGVLQPKKENEDVYDHTMRVLDAMRSSPDIEKAGNPTLLFAALFHDAGKPKTRRENPQTGHVSFYNHNVVSAGIAGRWLKQFKASTIGIDTHLVCHLIKNHMFETKHFLNNEKSLRRFINKVGVEPIFDLLDLRLADKMGGRFPKKLFGILSLRDKVREEINKAPPFTPKDLAINGHDIMTLGYQPGPIFGEIQRFLMDKVLDDPELNTKEILLRLITDNKDQLLQLLQ